MLATLTQVSVATFIGVGMLVMVLAKVVVEIVYHVMKEVDW